MICGIDERVINHNLCFMFTSVMTSLIGLTKLVISYLLMLLVSIWKFCRAGGLFLI